MTTTTLPRRSIDDWVAKLQVDYPDLQSVPDFVTLYSNDLDRIENGEASRFDAIISATSDLAEKLMSQGITQDDLPTLQAELRGPTSLIYVPVLSVEEQELAHDAIGELVADELLPNKAVDDAATESTRVAAEAQVETQQKTYVVGEVIANEGETLDQVQVDAINKLDLVEKAPGTSRKAIVLLGALAVGLTAFFL
ncbi:MAG: hypothetical protein WBV06_09850 [Acidimicrobiia bacterium]